MAGSGPRPLPIAAGALLVGGVVYSHSSIRGDKPPDLHPLLRRFIRDLPVTARERYAGWCAETVLVSDRLYEAEDAAGPPLTPARAREALWGAHMSVYRVREPDDPTHAQPQPPCRTCSAVLEWLGVDAVLES
jgi:hypothetical protein